MAFDNATAGVRKSIHFDTHPLNRATNEGPTRVIGTHSQRLGIRSGFRRQADIHARTSAMRRVPDLPGMHAELRLRAISRHTENFPRRRSAKFARIGQAIKSSSFSKIHRHKPRKNSKKFGSLAAPVATHILLNSTTQP